MGEGVGDGAAQDGGMCAFHSSEAWSAAWMPGDSGHWTLCRPGSREDSVAWWTWPWPSPKSLQHHPLGAGQVPREFSDAGVRAVVKNTFLDLVVVDTPAER